MKDFNKYYDFIADETTKLAVRKIADKAQLVERRSVINATDFSTQNVIEYSMPIINNCNINFKLFPDYLYSERKSLILYPEFIDEIDINDFVCAVRIFNKSKFRDLDHKDYLGSIMSLGVDRDKIGDIYVHDSFADVILHKEFRDIISFGLEQIGKNKIEIKDILLSDVEYKEPDHDLITINTTSMRLDNVVKSLINKSRDFCSDIIRSGDVKVNFSIEERVAHNVKKGDLISIRKFGRFFIFDENGNTRSGKYKLTIKHYVKKT